jgi:hypothetical protein
MAIAEDDYDYEEINDSNPLANYWLEGKVASVLCKFMKEE